MRGGQTFFDLFNLIDATTEPEVNPPKEVWLGARIVAATEDNETDDAMLHDDFFDARRDYDGTQPGGMLYDRYAAGQHCAAALFQMLADPRQEPPTTLFTGEFTAGATIGRA